MVLLYTIGFKTTIIGSWKFDPSLPIIEIVFFYMDIKQVIMINYLPIFGLDI